MSAWILGVNICDPTAKTERKAYKIIFITSTILRLHYLTQSLFNTPVILLTYETL